MPLWILFLAIFVVLCVRRTFEFRRGFILYYVAIVSATFGLSLVLTGETLYAFLALPFITALMILIDQTIERPLDPVSRAILKDLRENVRDHTRGPRFLVSGPQGHQVERRFPALHRFLTAAYHRDWRFEFPSADAAAWHYKEITPPPKLDELRDDIRAFLDAFSDEQESDALVALFECGYHPRMEGVSARSWLKRMHGVLDPSQSLGSIPVPLNRPPNLSLGATFAEFEAACPVVALFDPATVNALQPLQPMLEGLRENPSLAWFRRFLGANHLSRHVGWHEIGGFVEGRQRIDLRRVRSASRRTPESVPEAFRVFGDSFIACDLTQLARLVEAWTFDYYVIQFETDTRGTWLSLNDVLGGPRYAVLTPPADRSSDFRGPGFYVLSHQGIRPSTEG